MPRRLDAAVALGYVYIDHEVLVGSDAEPGPIDSSAGMSVLGLRYTAHKPEDGSESLDVVTGADFLVWARLAALLGGHRRLGSLLVHFEVGKDLLLLASTPSGHPEPAVGAVRTGILHAAVEDPGKMHPGEVGRPWAAEMTKHSACSCISVLRVQKILELVFPAQLWICAAPMLLKK